MQVTNSSIRTIIEKIRNNEIILPALFPDEPSLNYHNLDERCQNGGNAMTLFPRIKDMEPEEAAASREALLRYCELDTWAMVKVWQKLKEKAGVI